MKGRKKHSTVCSVFGYFLSILPLVLLSGCGGTGASKFVLPASLGGFTRGASGDAGTIPPAVRRFQPRHVHSAYYLGKGRVEVTVWELGAEAAGLELEQTWKPAPRAVAFHRGRFFAAVGWQADTGRSAVNALVRDLGALMAAAD